MNFEVMEKHVYRVQAQYIFAGVFDVVATTREEAREKIERHCGVVMDRSIHTEKRIGRITKERVRNDGRFFCPLLFP